MKTSYLQFTKKVHYRSTAMDYIQCWVEDIIEGTSFWLHFSSSSKMFRRVCNISSNRVSGCGTFRAVVKYNEVSNNRAKEIEGIELKDFQKENISYFNLIELESVETEIGTLELGDILYRSSAITKDIHRFVVNTIYADSINTVYDGVFHSYDKRELVIPIKKISTYSKDLDVIQIEYYNEIQAKYKSKVKELEDKMKDLEDDLQDDLQEVDIDGLRLRLPERFI